jgi:hypothetical protein
MTGPKPQALDKERNLVEWMLGTASISVGWRLSFVHLTASYVWLK